MRKLLVFALIGGLCVLGCGPSSTSSSKKADKMDGKTELPKTTTPTTPPKTETTPPKTETTPPKTEPTPPKIDTTPKKEGDKKEGDKKDSKGGDSKKGS